MLKIPISPFDEGEGFDVPIEDAARKRRDEEIITFFENGFHILNAYQSRQKTAKQILTSLRAFQFALGFHLVAGADGLADLARQCGVSKQAMGKCVNHFISQLKLSPLASQRNQQARDNMARARKEQVIENH